MAEFVFTSPGVKFKEKDLSFVTRNVGVTTLGLVGETLKGAAFEPVYVEDKTEFASKFGYQSVEKFSSGKLKYQLPFVANSYLEESNQLWVTRVLGLSGYDAGKAWALSVEAGLDPTTVASGATTGFTDTFTDNVYLGVTLQATGDTGTAFTGFTKVSGGTTFSGLSKTFVATTYTGATGAGTVTGTSINFGGSEYTDYKNMIIGILRSRASVADNINLAPTTTFETTLITISSNASVSGVGDLFGTFTLTATSGATTEDYVVSVNPSSSSYVPNVVGSKPKGKDTMIWVEAIYPDLIKKIDNSGASFASNLSGHSITGISPYAYGVSSTVIVCSSDFYTDYKTQFKTPETPWVVSQIKGNSVSRLFKFISISDGDSANQEIKFSITNINPTSLEFDVIVRSFYDTDDNVVTLESFTRCSLIEGNNNYIANRVGTSDGEYTLRSEYFMLEMADDFELSDFPAGFEGYLFNNYAISATSAGLAGIAPQISYKTGYTATEKLGKTYLGVSENGYDGASIIGTGINQNFFNFNGQLSTGSHILTNGYHMDIEASGVTSNSYSFDAGAATFQSTADIADSSSPYYSITARKFTLVSSRGFDGWDVNRTERSYGNLYAENAIYDGVIVGATPTNDYQAWQTAINTFSNPEEVTINVFATPSIDWSNQNTLVLDTIEMIETERTDTLYVIDSPDVTVTQTIGDGGKADYIASADIVDLLDVSSVDSSYACTYFPYVQIKDTQNGVNLYLPPTGEVVRAMAYTDNTKFPWYAPAGLNRGVTNAIKSKYKLSLDSRDVLYDGRINPIVDFPDVGTAIFGQKTLQSNESALNRINVRRLLLQIKVLISNIATRLLFDQNDQTTIDQFLSQATPTLDTIKRERGLYDFRIKMDESNNTTVTMDRNELYGEIFLKPTRSLEFIGITFTITPTGASFDDVSL